MATAAWDVNDLLSLYVTFRWTDWSSFKDLDINYSVGPVTMTKNVHNAWKDTYLVSLGADMRFYDWWTMRAGIGYETSAVDEAQYARPSFRMLTVCGSPWVRPLRLPKTSSWTFLPRGCTVSANVTFTQMIRAA